MRLTTVTSAFALSLAWTSYGTQAPLRSPSYPLYDEQANATSVIIGDRDIQLKPYHTVYISPRSLHFWPPFYIAKEIVNAIDAKEIKSVLIVDCNTLDDLPTIEVKLEGREPIVLRGPEYILQLGDNCVSSISLFLASGDNPEQPIWAIGQTYLHHYDLSVGYQSPYTQGSEGRQPVIPGIATGTDSFSVYDSMTKNTTVRMQLRAMEMGSYYFSPKDIDALILETEASMTMVVPAYVADAFHSEMGATNSVLAVDCSAIPNLPDLNIYLGRGDTETVVRLKAASYIIRAGHNCFSPFIGVEFTDDNKLWYIGDMFMHNYWSLQV